MTAPRKRAAARPAAPVANLAADVAPPNLLRAGLKALGHARDGVAQRQGRVFELLLGVEPGQPASGFDAAARRAAQEAFGLRRFEAVFDQRVLQAMQRMGLPSIEALQAMSEEVAALKAELRSLKAARRPR